MSSKSSKYLILIYNQENTPTIESILKKCKMPLEESVSIIYNKLTKDSSKVYILLYNQTEKIINSFIKQTEFNKGILRFKVKSKLDIKKSDLKNIAGYDESYEELFDIFYKEEPNLYFKNFYIPSINSQLYELISKNFKGYFKGLKKIMKNFYKLRIKEKKNNEKIGQGRLDNKKNESSEAQNINNKNSLNINEKNNQLSSMLNNNPVLYNMFNYSQLCLAMQK